MSIAPYISLARSIFQKSPSILTLFVTNRCNAKCRMCFNWKNMNDGKTREELSVDEITKIAGSFNGLHSLILSGGEPFLRKDLKDIVGAFQKHSGTKQVSIPTNLFCSDAPEMIKDIASSYPDVFFRILISIDGIGEEHDDIRGHKGGFDKLTNNLNRLISYKKELHNLSLNSVTVVSSFNADRIIPTLDHIRELDIDDIKLIYVRGDTREPEAKEVTPEIYQKCIQHAEKLTIKKKRTKSLYNNLFSSVSLVAKEEIAESLKTRRLPRPCNAGSKLIVISDTGEVFPCEILSEKFGDLREHNYSLSEVLNTERAKKLLDFINEKKCFCTMDCNAISNVIYSPLTYPRVLKKFLKFYK